MQHMQLQQLQMLQQQLLQQTAQLKQVQPDKGTGVDTQLLASLEQLTKQLMMAKVSLVYPSPHRQSVTDIRSEDKGSLHGLKIQILGISACHHHHLL